MKKLSIPSAMVGLTFGLIATAFVYLFVPPPSTASAASCPSIYEIKRVVANNCASSEEVADVGSDVQKYCYLWHD